MTSSMGSPPLPRKENHGLQFVAVRGNWTITCSTYTPRYKPQSDLPGLAPDYKPDHPRTSPPDSPRTAPGQCRTISHFVAVLASQSHIYGRAKVYPRPTSTDHPDRVGRPHPRCRYGLVPDCPEIDTDKLLVLWLICFYSGSSGLFVALPGLLRG